MRPVAPGAPADTDFDALPLDGIPPFDLPNRLKADDPIWRAAQNALYKIPLDQTGPAYHTALKAAVAGAIRSRGQEFPDWALDQSGIDIMMANRIAMGPGLAPARFKWIAFADPLHAAARHARRGGADAGHARRSTRAKRSCCSATSRDLERSRAARDARRVRAHRRERDARARESQRRRRASSSRRRICARSTSTTPTSPPRSARTRSTRAAARRRTPSTRISRTISFARSRARRADSSCRSRSTCSRRSAGSTRRAAARRTCSSRRSTIRRCAARSSSSCTAAGRSSARRRGCSSKPNVYADISMMDDILSPTVLAGVLRQWLGEWPDKVLFGTDAFDGGAEQGWEQVAWVGVDDGAARAWRSRSPGCCATARSIATARRRWRAWCCARTRRPSTGFLSSSCDSPSL